MSLLDDLKKQAADKEKSRVGPGDDAQQRTGRNWHLLSPKMGLIHNYLRDLAETLNVLQPQEPRVFQLNETLRLRGLVCKDYRLARRDRDSLKSFEFRYNMWSPQPRQVSVPGALEAEKLRPVLEAQSLCTYTEAVDGSNIVFTIDPNFIVSFNFSVDLDACAILLGVNQVSGPWVQRLRYHPDQVSEELLDEMGKLILGQPNRFMELSGYAVPDAMREQLRSELDREKQAARAPAPDDSGGGKSGAGRLFGLLKK